MNPIDFGSLRSKVKVTIDIYGNKLVNTIKTEPLCAFSSNLANMFTGIILAVAMYERILSLISIEWENLKINERISLCFQNNLISTWFTFL